MSRALAGSLVAAVGFVMLVSGCESRSDAGKVRTQDSEEPNNLQGSFVRLPEDVVAFHLTATALDGGPKIKVGQSFRVEGKIWSAERLTSTNMLVTLCQFIERRGLRSLHSERVELVEASDYLFTYSTLMTAPRNEGTYCLRIVSRGKVLDEHVITIKE